MLRSKKQTFSSQPRVKGLSAGNNATISKKKGGSLHGFLFSRVHSFFWLTWSLLLDIPTSPLSWLIPSFRNPVQILKELISLIWLLIIPPMDRASWIFGQAKE